MTKGKRDACDTESQLPGSSPFLPISQQEAKAFS